MKASINILTRVGENMISPVEQAQNIPEVALLLLKQNAEEKARRKTKEVLDKALAIVKKRGAEAMAMAVLPSSSSNADAVSRAPKRPAILSSTSQSKKVSGKQPGYLSTYSISPKNLCHLDGSFLLKIFNYLDSRQQLRVQAVCKAFAEVLEENWKQLKKDEDIDFYWAEAVSVYPEKSSYCLSKALFALVDVISAFQPQKFEMQTQQFDGIASSSAAFAALLQQERIRALYKLISQMGPSIPNTQDASLAKPKQPEANLLLSSPDEQFPYKQGGSPLSAPMWSARSATAGGGELLVDALMKMLAMKTDELTPQVKNAISLAMEKKATCVSYFAMQLLNWSADPGYFKALALAAANVGDYKALEKYYSANMPITGNDSERRMHLPPTLFAIAQEKAQTSLIEAEKLYERTLAGYQHKVPIAYVATVAQCKMSLKKEQEAKQILSRKIVKLINPSSRSFEHWGLAGNIALQLKDIKRAAFFYKQAIAAYQCEAAFPPFEKVSPIFDTASKVFAYLGDWQSILTMYKLVLSKYEKVPIPTQHFFANTALAYIKLNDLHKAASLYEQINHNVDTDHLGMAARINQRLGRWEKSALLFDKYHRQQKAKGKTLTQSDLEGMIYTNTQISNWAKVAEVYNQLFTAYKVNAKPIPRNSLLEIANVEAHLNRHAKAVELYEQAFSMSDEDIPIAYVARAALANHKANNLKRAGELFEQLSSTYYEKLPLDVVEGAASFYFEQEDWRKARDLFRIIQKNYDTTEEGFVNHPLFFSALASYQRMDAIENYLRGETDDLSEHKGAVWSEEALCGEVVAIATGEE